MTQRERILAAAVGLMLMTVIGLFALQRVRNQFDSRFDRLTQLEQEVARQERVIRQGKLADKQMGEYSERSLPENRMLARSLYEDWLLKMAVDVGFEGVNVSPLQGRASGEIYFQHAFLVSGQGNLEQATEFLYAFYRAGYLHRVSRLSAKPVARSKNLDLSLTVEALSLNSAPNRQELQQVDASRLAREDLAEYVEAIVARNMFSPGNNAPEISYVSSQTGYLGRPYRYQLRGSDPDEDDDLSYNLEGEAPEGIRVDGGSGQIEWTPQEKGEYEIEVRVTDNGLPAKSSTQLIKIAVVDPPPENKPEPQMGFDVAKHSVVTGITEISGTWQIWVTIRTEGRVLRLREGDALDVGSVKGVVSEIGRSEARIKRENGQELIVRLGGKLLDDTADEI